MLKDEIGLKQEQHWEYIYYKIPIENKELIDFFNNQHFSFQVKQVQYIIKKQFLTLSILDMHFITLITFVIFTS